MILVDTSVWADHFRRGDERLVRLLREGEVLIHPLVIEELACGRLTPRAETLSRLRALAPAPVASHEEALGFIEAESLAGSGIGAVDVHLLASARLAHARLWSRDRALSRAAAKLSLAA